MTSLLEFLHFKYDLLLFFVSKKSKQKIFKEQKMYPNFKLSYKYYDLVTSVLLWKLVFLSCCDVRCFMG